MKTIPVLVVSLAVMTTSYAQNTFPGSGSVGIGTTSPSTNLDVRGSIVDYRYVSGDSYVDAAIRGYSYSDGSGINTGIAGQSDRGNLGTNVGGYFTANGGVNNYALLTGNGNVGIGTMSPSAALHVVAPSTGTAVPISIFDRGYGAPGDTSTAIRVNLNSGAGGGYVAGYSGDFAVTHNAEYISGFGYVARQSAASQIDQAAGNILFNTNVGLIVGAAFTPTTRLFIQGSNGNVGIGTTSPVAKLVVGRNGGAGFELEPGVNAYGLTNVNYFTSFDRGTNVYTDLLFDLGGASMVLKSGGNVGIGTTTPSHKLSVNGTVRAKEVIVDTNWADYVFAKDYKLASLSEVEQHIQQQGHLPGVPSAAEVAVKGVSVGDMQAVLLAKIEELTLHQIAQEKRMATQDARLQSLEAENARLKGQAQ